VDKVVLEGGVQHGPPSKEAGTNCLVVELALPVEEAGAPVVIWVLEGHEAEILRGRTAFCPRPREFQSPQHPQGLVQVECLL